MVHSNSKSFNFKKKIGFNGDLQTKKKLSIVGAQVVAIKTKNVRPTCSENMTKFLLQTTFHGLKFVGNQSISYCERFLFLSSFLTAFAVAMYFILDVYNKWDISPVIVGISPFAIPISDIPFPAITICNVNQVQKSKVQNLLNDTLKSNQILELCNKENDIDLNKLSNMNLSSSIKDFEDFLLAMAQPCHKMLLDCMYGGVKQNCSQIFQPTITEEGMCCTFNKLHPEFFFLNANFRLINTFAQDGAVPVKWSATYGYPTKLPKKYYPRPSVGIGVSNGLSVILNADLDEYYCTSTHGAGFKVSIDTPIEEPNSKETGILVGTGMEARVRLDTKISEATYAVRSIQPRYRQCIFEEESSLVSFAVYSKRSCNMECDARYLYDICKCVDYFMPRLFANISTCGLKDVVCTRNVTFYNIESDDLHSQKYLECNKRCLPGCFDYSYKGDMFLSPIIPGKFKLKNKFIEDMNPVSVHRSITILNFFFSENAVHPNRKDQFIGMTEFLSYTGGLMGLFLGFSSISIIEIFYFCSLRPFCASYRYKKEVKSITLSNTAAETRDIQNGVSNLNEKSQHLFEITDQFKINKQINKIGYK